VVIIAIDTLQLRLAVHIGAEAGARRAVRWDVQIFVSTETRSKLQCKGLTWVYPSQV